MHRLWPVLILMTLPGWAAAGCFGAGQPLFHCTFKGGKSEVNICIQNDIVTYAYGAKGALPDMLLAQHAFDVDMHPWPGMGRYYWESMTLHNVSHSYGVSFSVDKLSPNAPVEAALRVYQGKKQLAELTCDRGSVFQPSFQPLANQKSASGQCWNPQVSSWVFC